MPVLKYLADTDTVSDYFRPGNLVVVTRNEKHFPGCKTVNPWRK